MNSDFLTYDLLLLSCSPLEDKFSQDYIIQFICVSHIRPQDLRLNEGCDCKPKNKVRD